MEVATAGRPTADPDRLTIEVSNDGTVSLGISDISLVVDETYVAPTDVSITVVDGESETDDTDLWLPGETLDIRIDDDDTEADMTTAERVSIVTESGVRVDANIAAVEITAAEMTEGTETDPAELAVDVDNTGAKTLNVSTTALLVDGEAVDIEAGETTVVDGAERDTETSRWAPGETLEIRIENDDVEQDISDAETVTIVPDAGGRDSAAVEN